jgi:hypothetical protein
MSRGDQRERDRAKNLAKRQPQANKREGAPAQRNESDAAALQAKIKAKKEQKTDAPPEPAKGPIPRKKVVKKKDTIDDLLSAGLTAAKKRAK